LLISHPPLLHGERCRSAGAISDPLHQLVLRPLHASPIASRCSESPADVLGALPILYLFQEILSALLVLRLRLSGIAVVPPERVRKKISIVQRTDPFGSGDSLQSQSVELPRLHLRTVSKAEGLKHVDILYLVVEPPAAVAAGEACAPVRGSTRAWSAHHPVCPGHHGYHDVRVLVEDDVQELGEVVLREGRPDSVPILADGAEEKVRPYVDLLGRAESSHRSLLLLPHLLLVSRRNDSGDSHGVSLLVVPATRLWTAAPGVRGHGVVPTDSGDCDDPVEDPREEDPRRQRDSRGEVQPVEDVEIPLLVVVGALGRVILGAGVLEAEQAPYVAPDRDRNVRVGLDRLQEPADLVVLRIIEALAD
jgi:hypothetical protein